MTDKRKRAIAILFGYRVERVTITTTEGGKLSGDEIPTFSRLDFQVGDHKELGFDSCILITGFSGMEEVQRFMDALYTLGVIKPPKEARPS